MTTTKTTTTGVGSLGFGCVRLMVMTIVLQEKLIQSTVDGAVLCNHTSLCEELLRPGSKCMNGYCTNPFYTNGGCLRTLLNNDEEEQRRYKKRICNSHDDYDLHGAKANGKTDDDAVVCMEPLLDYPEIRILSQDWESAMFTAWILQIVLSELLGVPASIESSHPDRNCNFYDLYNSFSYGAISYDYDALKTASDVGDCTHFVAATTGTTNSHEEYKSCAHVMPEVWNGQAENYIRAEVEGIIEPPEGNGAVGKLGWYVPYFVGRNYPRLVSYLGMRGQENRRRLAKVFKRPTNWKDYCEFVSKDNCATNDGIATRPPMEGEYDRYHVAGSYLGHFRATEKNDCDKHPKTCSGHIADLPCQWSTFAHAQAYHLDIAVESDGPLQPNGGYTYGMLLDIWAAANATKSPVLFYWWIPDPTEQSYKGTDSEFIMVQLPPPTQECVLNRVIPEERCSLQADASTRAGDPVGSCDTESHSLLKLVSSNLFSQLNQGPEETRSPAYEAIKGFQITELQLGQIFDYWSQRNIDRWNYDPREATCRWVVENLDYLQTLIPRTYPRTIHEESNYGQVFFNVAFSFAIFVSVFVMMIAILTYRYRKSPVMEYAQIGFLYLLLFGLFLVSIGSIMLATEPSAITCVARVWFVALGYTFELLPLIVKVAAINRMMQAARRLKRVKLKRKDLYVTVAIAITIVTFYLIAWTALDPPQRKDTMQLTQDLTNAIGGDRINRLTVMQLTHFCSSNVDTWQYISVSWQVVLLISATVLAIQTRNLRQDFNESQTMAFMIYSHFFFVCLQLITILLQDAVQPNTLEAYRSLIFSVDAIVGMFMYFLPKLHKAYNAIDVLEQTTQRHRSTVYGSSDFPTIQMMPFQHIQQEPLILTRDEDNCNQPLGKCQVLDKFTSLQISLREVRDLIPADNGQSLHNSQWEVDQEQSSNALSSTHGISLLGYTSHLSMEEEQEEEEEEEEEVEEEEEEEVEEDKNDEGVEKNNQRRITAAEDEAVEQQQKQQQQQQQQEAETDMQHNHFTSVREGFVSDENSDDMSSLIQVSYCDEPQTLTVQEQQEKKRQFFSGRDIVSSSIRSFWRGPKGIQH